ncbi:hypothetical protein V6N13_004109 [Hibiscus sabdariffa]
MLNGWWTLVHPNISAQRGNTSPSSREGTTVMGNSSSFEVLGKGKVLLKLTSSKTLALNNVMYVPALRRNLISGCLLNKACIKLVFEIDKLVLSRNDDYIGKGFLNGGLFVIETQLNENKVSTSTYIVETVDMWHARLGHMNIHSLKKMMKMNILPKLDITNFNKCEICVEAKHAKPHFKSVSNRKTELLELIHTDLADFRNTESKGGKHYYITFVDDFSRYTKVYLLRTKDEAEKFFLIYKAEVENQFDRRIKRLRSDRGGEYGSNFLKSVGCLAKVGLPDFKKSTIGSKTVDVVFIGLDSETQIEKLPSTSSSVPARSSQEIEFEPRRSKRQRVETSFGPDFITSFISELNDCDTLFDPIAQTFLLDKDPKTYEEAIRSIDSSFLKNAINDELE